MPKPIDPPAAAVDPPAAAVHVSVADLVRQVRAGEQSALELTEVYLERIGAAEPQLNAFRTVTADAARRRAHEIDEQVRAGAEPGPLAGVPVALKDNIAVAGVPLTAGTGLLRDNVAGSDAWVTRALLDAGAVFLGKLHMAEWAIGGTTHNVHFGPGHNPWDHGRVPGGSSGGSAVAVAADLAPVTLGSDSGGSIRIPAALCGVVGLRPTLGRVSTRGSLPVSWSFDAIGPLARRAEDVAAVLGVIAGYDPEDPVCVELPVDDYGSAIGRDVEGLRLGVLGGTFRGEPLEAATAELLDQAVAQLAGLGMRAEETVLDQHLHAVQVTAEILLAEAAGVHARRLADDPEHFAPDVLARLRRGQAISGPAYACARQEQRRWRRAVFDLLKHHDLLLAPACPFVAPPITGTDPLQMTGLLAQFISIWGLAEVPALVAPIGFVAGLPVAMQLIGRPFDEATLLRVAHAYQQVTDWHQRRPQSVRTEGGGG
ncbi:MAG: amidase [Solirubrobacterales bacterium]|nr:amidase [Solirubrobacterales bacterium]